MKNLNTSKKSRTTFIIVLIISMFIGGTIGYLGIYMADIGLSSKMNSITPNNLFSIIFYLGLAIILILIIVSFKLRFSIKSELKNLNEPSEYNINDSTSTKLSLYITINSLNAFFSIGWLLCLITIPMQNSLLKSFINENFIVKILISIFLAAFVFLNEIYSLKTYNKIYTNKGIDVLSFKLSSELFQKLDEGEKWITLLAAYKVFTLMSNLILFLMIISMFLSILLDVNVTLTIIILTFILIFNKLAYYLTARKLEKISD